MKKLLALATVAVLFTACGGDRPRHGHEGKECPCKACFKKCKDGADKKVCKKSCKKECHKKMKAEEVK